MKKRIAEFDRNIFIPVFNRKKSPARHQPHRGLLFSPIIRKLLFYKLVFSNRAQWTLKIFRYILPFGSRSNPSVRISGLFVIYPSANFTYIFHNQILLSCLLYWSHYNSIHSKKQVFIYFTIPTMSATVSKPYFFI